MQTKWWINARLVAQWEFGDGVEVGAAEPFGEHLRDLAERLGEVDGIDEVAAVVHGLAHGVRGAELAAAAARLRAVAWMQPDVCNEMSPVSLVAPDEEHGAPKILALSALLEHAALMAGPHGLVRAEERR